MSSTSTLFESGVLIRGALALVPVLFFLLALVWLDSYKLFKPRRIFGALLAGATVGVLGYATNTALLDLTGLPMLVFAIVLAPVVEESLKAAFVVWFVRTGRAGFLVDAAILGFAVGAGFSLLENLYYLHRLPNAPWIVWIVRGFGTALMHGGCTAIFAVTARSLWRPRGGGNLRAILPGLVIASALHAGFNRAMVQPLLTTGVMLLVLPAIFVLVYRMGEKRLRRWVGSGFDRDQELLAFLREGDVGETPLGRYLISLRESFPAAQVADMLCLLRLRAELSVAVKGRLLLREHGFGATCDQEAGDDLTARLAEARWLEKSVGRAGLLALRPVSRGRDRSRWERKLLRQWSGAE